MRYALTAILLLTLTVRAEEKTFDSNGVKIAYLDEGKGEAVVLLHGFGGSAPRRGRRCRSPRPSSSPALKDYRVLAVDHRGHGKSDKPHDPKKYGKEMAEDVVRLLDHLKVKKAHVVGYSMGAFVAGQAAGLAPRPAAQRDVRRGRAACATRPRRSRTRSTRPPSRWRQGKGIGPLIIALTPDGAKKPTPGAGGGVRRRCSSGARTRRRWPPSCAGQPGWTVTEAELKANKVPVQFVYGSREATFLKDLIEASRKVLPKAEVVVVEKGDHGSTFTTTEFRDAVLKFLKANGK